MRHNGISAIIPTENRASIEAIVDARVAYLLAERDKAHHDFWRRIWRGLTQIARAIESEYPVRPEK